MKNKEKYLNIVVESIFGACPSLALRKLAGLECTRRISCNKCIERVMQWLEAECVEDVEIEPILHRKTVDGKVVENE